MNYSVAFLQAFVAAALCGNLACAQTNSGFGRPADKPVPRTDRNSQIAHEQLLEKIVLFVQSTSSPFKFAMSPWLAPRCQQSW